MITPLDSRVMDINAEYNGITVQELMLNAGNAVARYVLDNHPGAKVRVFCGRGNNGGDGLAAAALVDDFKITMVDGDTMKSDASRHFAKAVEGRMELFTGVEDDFDVLVDAGLGIGPSGQLRSTWKEYVEFCNEFEGTVISVDVPTGFGTDVQVVPDVTVTMVDVKEGMNEKTCGKIVVADIGMPLEATLCTGPGDVLRYPVPAPNAHKGNSGRLLIIGGGPYLGAPALATRAAMRIGTDMVYTAVPSRVVNTVSVLNPECVLKELHDGPLDASDVPAILELASRCDAVLIGPGLGTAEETMEAVRTIVESVEIPMVIDADGITAVAGMRLRDNIIVTPHNGEFKRLGGTDAEPAGVRDLAGRLGCTVLLKGRTDTVSDGENLALNFTGCAAMTSAGTGDVLSGVTAGLLARGMTTFNAAKLAAWITGLAGESVFAEKSYGLCASDVADMVAVELGKALKNVGA